MRDYPKRGEGWMNEEGKVIDTKHRLVKDPTTGLGTGSSRNRERRSSTNGASLGIPVPMPASSSSSSSRRLKSALKKTSGHVTV